MPSEKGAELRLKALRKQDGNMTCPNCGNAAPQGIGYGNICIKFKTFVCNNCKSSHQAISHRVKSCTMSDWTAAEVDSLMDENGGGNLACRHVWLDGAPPPGGRYATGSRPKDGDHIDVFKKFITDAYEHGKFKATEPYRPASGGNTPTPGFSAPSSPRPAASAPAPTSAPAFVGTAAPTPAPAFDFMGAGGDDPFGSSSSNANYDPFASNTTATPAAPATAATFDPFSAPASASAAAFDPFSDPSPVFAQPADAPKPPSSSKSDLDFFSVPFPPAAPATMTHSVSNSSFFAPPASDPFGAVPALLQPTAAVNPAAVAQQNAANVNAILSLSAMNLNGNANGNGNGNNGNGMRSGNGMQQPMGGMGMGGMGGMGMGGMGGMGMGMQQQPMMLNGNGVRMQQQQQQPMGMQQRQPQQQPMGMMQPGLGMGGPQMMGGGRTAMSISSMGPGMPMGGMGGARPVGGGGYGGGYGGNSGNGNGNGMPKADSFGFVGEMLKR